MRLTEAGMMAMDELCGNAGAAERDALSNLLSGLPKDVRLAIDEAAGALIVSVMESAFLAGLSVGRNPWAVILGDGS